MQDANQETSSVEAFPEAVQPSIVSDELNRLSSLLREEFPFAARVSFEFDRTLHVHIDVRRREDVSVVENRIESLGAGTLFGRADCGNTPGHPFIHRISATVAR